MLEQIIISVGPQRPYIHRTLESLKSNVPVILVMDSAEDYLPEYSFTKILRQQSGTPFAKALQNYCLCLALAAGKNTLIIEDDVELRANWQEDLDQFVAYVERVFSTYILSIGEHGYPLTGVQVGSSDKFMARGPLQIDYGLVREPLQQVINTSTGQALLCLTNTNARYFPKTIDVEKVIKWMLDAFASSQISYDLLLDRYVFETQMKLFISQYPLSKHIGKNSGLGNDINAPLD